VPNKVGLETPEVQPSYRDRLILEAWEFAKYSAESQAKESVQEQTMVG